MCGILGQISINQKEQVSESIFINALNLQEVRGPDEFGVHRDDKFIFGHRRLSIIDLDAKANQPMFSDDQQLVITFNGEIYNYLELKKDLVDKGYSFRTNSDTEVLLYSYKEKGIDCIKDFIGMFAFSIYDKETNVSYLVRDRLGIKPLYIHEDKECITFSSEIKSIIELKGLTLELNYDAVSSYLSYRYPILDDTFFKEINSLPPGHYLELKPGIPSKKVEYWTTKNCFEEQKEDKGEKYYLDRLTELLESSVKYRMISDVPFGAFLSGGVDSSVVTNIMSSLSKEKIKTFTIGFDDDGYNEFDFAKIIAKESDTDHREIVLSGENYIETQERLIERKDAPLSVPNEVPLYLMSKELKKYITVVLSGEGADEIFGGYGRIFRSPYDYDRITNIDTLDLTEDEKNQFSKKIIKKYAVETFSDELEHFTNIYSYTSVVDKKSLLHPSLDLNSIEEKLTNKFLQYFEELEGDSYYNKIMYTFEKVHLVGLLHRVDTSTMAASVEARVPFVDHRLVEFAFTIPVKYKLKWASDNSQGDSKILLSDEISEVHDVPKYILKKAYEGKVSDEVLYRKKMGFPVPLNKWFGGEFNAYAKNLLLSDVARSRNLYNLENIESWLTSDKLVKDHSFAMKIWMLVNLELFMLKYFKVDRK